MRLQALMLLGCAAAAAQDSPVASDANQILEQLTKATSDPKPFRARYQSEGMGDDMSVLFEYQSEGRLHMLAESGAGRAESWIDGSVFTLLGTSPQGSVWASVDWADPDIVLPDWFDLLESRFPWTGEWARYRAFMIFSWALNEQTDKVDFNVSVGCGRGPETCLFGWLRELQEDATLLRVTEDALIQDHPRFRATVSRSTGFLDELMIVSKTGEKAYIRLASLEMDVELEDSAFVPPQRPESAEDISEGWAQSLFIAELSDPRRTTFSRVNRLLAQGELDWTTRAWDDLEAVLRDVHQPQVQSVADDANPKVRTSIEAFFEELRQRVSKGETRAALEPEIKAWRADLERSLEEGMDELYERCAPPLEEADSSTVRDDLLSIEAYALTKLGRELLRQPILDEFDTTAERFLRG